MPKTHAIPHPERNRMGLNEARPERRRKRTSSQPLSIGVLQQMSWVIQMPPGHPHSPLQGSGEELIRHSPHLPTERCPCSLRLKTTMCDDLSHRYCLWTAFPDSISFNLCKSPGRCVLRMPWYRKNTGAQNNETTCPLVVCCHAS